jgi:putative methanogenesis marker protein 8
MQTEELLRRVGLDRAEAAGLHISRMMHALVVVKAGEVVRVTEPQLEYCPLVSLLYEGRGGAASRAELREWIAEMTREKIKRFGHFTERRELDRGDIAVPYGASEMMMYALRRGVIDAAVTVCDGAGTVIADRPELVQGIGARMNGLFHTSPIERVIARIEEHGGRVPFAATAAIDQVGGAERAAELGYRNIAVTVNGYLGDPLAGLRQLESDRGVSVTTVVVCTTGADRARVKEMRDHADLVWSCASASVREIVGAASIVQVSSAIPVFAVTERGVRFLAAYSLDDEVFAGLDFSKQYLIAGGARGTPIRMGHMKTSLAEAALPVRSAREPRPLTA